MSPDDIAVVQRSWAGLRRRRDDLVRRLALELGALDVIDTGDVAMAARRAAWLVGSVDELTGLLRSASRLEARARELFADWPVAGVTPTFAVDGTAWMAAARSVAPSWSDEMARAWRRAWLLVSEVLALDALSPFAAASLPGSEPRS